ncbi:hypothetical protein GOP47_0015149 [Adiantum capillus-veneris]|uniref:EF-hand domain-containing protein n=1 Tax=Adiantum capillus-veneris TaxID=13818 RepID=A0A9D4UMT7_ADICA|nr:hypothetical protein GOP47_0015149 [Adiantum capillus-veneris]
MASFMSSFTSRDWSPTWLLNRLLKPQFLFQSSQSCSLAACNGVPPTPPSAQGDAAAATNLDDSSISRVTSNGAVSQQEMVALGRIFDHFDENKDGKISRDELRRSLHMLGIEADDEELIAMIDAVDWNSDGFLDFSEFASFYYSLNEEMGQKMDPSNNGGNLQTNQDNLREKNMSNDGEEADLRDAFKLFDKDGDGYICAEELQSVLANMGLSQGKILADCRNMISSVDVDGDGQVSFDEFKQMMVIGFGQS